MKKRVYKKEFESGKYVEIIIDDSVIACDKTRDAVQQQKSNLENG